MADRVAEYEPLGTLNRMVAVDTGDQGAGVGSEGNWPGRAGNCDDDGSSLLMLSSAGAWEVEGEENGRAPYGNVDDCAWL
jgi:hypothetical protein